MKNLLPPLFLLTFYAILSVSVFAGNRKTQQLARTFKDNPDLHGLVTSRPERMPPSVSIKNSTLQALTATEIIQVGDYEIQHLASIFNDYNQMAFVVSATVSKDSGRIEKILIDSYNKGNFLGRKNLEMESFLKNGFTLTLHQIEVFSIQAMGFGLENGVLLKLQYLEDYYRDKYASVTFSLLKNKDDGVWMLTNENGQRINTIRSTVDPSHSGHPPSIDDMSMSAEPLSKSTKNPVLQVPVTTKIRYEHNRSSIILELSPEGEIHTIYFDMYHYHDMYNSHRRKHPKTRIPLKNLFKETYTAPTVYDDRLLAPTPPDISPISLHPLDFNPRDGGTFAIRYKNRHFFKLFSTSKEVIMSLIKNKGEWFLADEEGRPINNLWIEVINPRVVHRIVADPYTSAERKLKIHSCEESARALLL